MSDEILYQENPNDQEFGKDRVTTSRYLFYLNALLMLAFLIGCSYNLYRASQFESKPKVEVNSSSEYKPVYK